MQLGCRSHAARVLPSLLSARHAAWGGMEQRRRSALMAGAEGNRCSSPHQKERDRAPEPDVGDLASSCSSTVPPMTLPRRPAAGSLASSYGDHSALSPLSTCVHSHSSPAAPPAACAVHSMRAQRCSRCRSELVCVQYSERHLFPLVAGPWPCHSEMLAMQLGACVHAVERAPSPSLPMWSVDHGSAARRRSPCGSGLMRVESGKGHLFPCNLPTMTCSFGDSRVRFRARSRAIRQASVHVKCS
ncbi:uncharacterized protein [Triticum aestivum]|uniref:uncharacterized protein n=2 Tax=Triticum TaxID=4564 RepID=UPI001D004CDE|nr:uncharacterized protein LOC123172603 [Triticum aestivum]